ncbi:MAG: CPBP family intramembrane metalloprotease, partial [Bacteroidales bacterium]|nr:CPBP family intramembrane metalloprotease [Bacteroidales bacterium]
MTSGRKLSLAIAVAAVLWFFMFSPWTGGLTNFWLTMAFSAVVLTTLAVSFTPDLKELLKIEKPLMQVVGGVLLAFALWGIFWIGDKVSSWMFGFARP